MHPGNRKKDDGQPPQRWRLRTTVWRVFTSRNAGERGRGARAYVQDNDGMSSEHHGDRRASDSGRHVTHQPSTSTAWMPAFVAIVLLLSLAAPVAAGPLEDGRDAYNRGDYATALRLLHPLADQGHAYAQFNLGLMYDYGWGVPQNYAEAVKWFRLAADQGNAGAQIKLGLMYQLGQGVPQDYIHAHMWLNLAAAQGYRFSAEERNSIANRMTPAQIAEAQKLAREWQSKRP
jgi:hypothetical protein